MLANMVCKTLLAAAACWGLHITVTPPNQAKKDGEVTKGLYEWMFVWSPLLLKALAWTGIVAELYLSRAYQLWDISIWTLFGAAMAVAGGMTRLQCYAALGERFTFELKSHQGRKLPLVTTGPYEQVRHPGYLAGTLVFFGYAFVFLEPRSAIAFSLGHGWIYLYLCSLPVQLLIGLIPRLLKEEALLRREFEAEWTAYTKKTRWMLVPGLV